MVACLVVRVLPAKMFGIFIFCAFLVSRGYGLPTPPEYDVIVVGLGASGTAAATTLARAGKRVLALEAQNRVGGRVYTVPFGNSLVEVGAEWIHGIEKSKTYELATAHNISILNQEVATKVFYSDGISRNEKVVSDLATFSLEMVDDLPDNPEPMGQHITKRVLEHIRTDYPSLQNDTEFIDSFLEFMDIAITTYESSNSWNDVTTHSTSVELKGSQTMSWHSNGYKTLFDILLNTYNGGPGLPSLSTRLNTAVTRVEWPRTPSESVRVTTAAGDTFTARAVIVTVSVGVLKERYEDLFSPPLPQQKIDAIKAIQIGVCSKIIFRFSTVWWTPQAFNCFLWRKEDKEKLSAEDKWLAKIEGAGTPMANNESLTLWACGDTAKKTETLPEDVLQNKLMGLLRRFMGTNKTIPEPVQMLRTTWFSNPYTRGAYSYDDVLLPQHPTARAELAAPLTDDSGAPRLLFAGEATNTEHFATVHGALETGFREAARLLPLSS